MRKPSLFICLYIRKEAVPASQIDGRGEHLLVEVDGPRISVCQAVLGRAARIEFTHPDSQPDDKLNELIWKSLKGANSQMPAPVNSRPPGGDDDVG